MSLYGMMRTSVSGMTVQADRLSTVADNIANAGTTGYKRTSIEFSTQVLDNATASYESGSVQSVSRAAISQQGALRGTNSATDLAISGEGFFIVQDESQEFYLTRAGSFNTDENGNLLNAAGYALMGYDIANQTSAPVANGFAGLEQINVSTLALTAVASTQAEMVPNLPAGATVVAPGDLPSANTATAEFSGKTSLLAYDSLGNEKTIDVYFAKTAPETWEVTVYDKDASTNGGFPYSSGPLAQETLDFDPANGYLLGSSPSTLTVPFAPPAQLELDLTGISQLGTGYSVPTANVDGNSPAAVERMEIDGNGIVYGIYQNGYAEPLYQIPLASVPSADNLRALPGNAYAATIESGDVLVGLPEQPGFGSLVSGAVEESNVDMATELTIMIESQRSYTANSKVFQTGSDLMDVLISLKR
ncbi:flagellar hook protein FlgE [Salaquimonas pukyongi]|uniref:flagellar hook protein FlgE n=1 Tax=Salaquimonas pukyongi TaxID=2712698 RepID=UPI00096BCD15|nr:flagellar hook protein FlgE [Salaquimonas pukyongi]